MKSKIVVDSPLPKYQQAMDIMIADIRDRKFAVGSRFLSEHEWADRLGISRQTVRQALAQLERDGYLRCEQGRGTFVTPLTPATSKRAGGQIRDIGVLVSCVTKYAAMIRAVEDVCQDNGYHLIIGNSDFVPEKEKRYIEEWLARPLAGLVLFPSYNSRLLDYLPLRDRQVPFVLVDSNIEGLNADLVGTDNVRGALEGTRLLISHGCRRLAFVSGYSSASTSRARREGYRLALTEAGLPDDHAIVLEGGFNAEFGAAVVAELLARRPDLDGLFIANHPITEGAVPALLAAGRRIPQDIKVGTFDEPDLPFESRVPLIMVKQQTVQEGRAAAEQLLRRIAERRGGPGRARAVVTNLAAQIVDQLASRGRTEAGAVPRPAVEVG